MKTLQRTRGLVQDLAVTAKGGMVTLWSESGIRHSVYNCAEPHLPGLEYARDMLLTLAFCPKAESCLVLGLGGGSIPRMLISAWPNISLQAVEIDPAVVQLASRFFHIQSLPQLTIYQQEASEYLANCASRYQIIIVDTYVGEQFPHQCTTKEFFADAKNCLLDTGVLAVNWLSEDVKLGRNLLKNLESIIGQVWQLSCPESGNTLYFALPSACTRLDIISAAEEMETAIPFESSLKRLAQRLRNPK